MPAGHALAVTLVALLAGAVLNAQALLATAERQPFGWRRSVGVALAKPVARVTAFAGLDRPRRALDRALGHREPDRAPAPPQHGAGASGPTTTVTTAPPRTPTADNPLRLWIAGDSMAQVFGQSLVNKSVETGVIDATLDYRISSGLTRPDFFDWPAHLRAELAERRPETVVLVFGANDAQGLLLDGHAVPYGTPAWFSEYRRRVDDVLSITTAGGRRVVWVGLPVMRSATYSAHVRQLNDVYREAVERYPGATFVDSWNLFAGPDGGYDAYAHPENGAPVLLRQADGIHLTRAGGDRLAEVVLDRIRAGWPRTGAR